MGSDDITSFPDQFSVMAKTVVDAQRLIDRNAAARIQVFAPLWQRALEHCPDLAAALTPLAPHIEESTISLAMEVVRSRSDTIRAQMGFAGTPLNIYYERTFGSSQATRSRVMLTIASTSPV